MNNADSEESDVNSSFESSDDDTLDGNQGVNNADSEESDDNLDEDPVMDLNEDPVVDNLAEEPVVVETVDEDDEDDADTQMDAAYGEWRSDHNRRPRRKVSYSHLHVNFEELNLGHLEELNQGVECHEEQIKGLDEQEDKPLATPQMSMNQNFW